jgi:hypothetical protein
VNNYNNKGGESGLPGRSAMKRMMLLLVAAVVIAGTIPARAEGPTNERAYVQFNEMVRLNDVFLQGRYLFIHDAEKMAKGQDCTWIYGADGRFVASFHCMPVERRATKQFKVLISQRAGVTDVPRVLEIQFPGSEEGHQIP